MINNIFDNAEWIYPEEFSGTHTVNIFHKANVKTDIDCPEEFMNFHYLVKKKFNIELNDEKYIIRLTADDYFHLYINGKFAGQGPAQGYYSDYHWNEYDITDFLHSGENEICVHVYYHGLICRSYVSGDRKTGLIASLKNGNNTVLVTDDSWQYAKINSYTGNNAIGYDTLFSEYFDARKETGEFKNVSVKEADYTFSEKCVKNLQIYDKTPVSVIDKGKFGKIYDFGTEITGTVYFEALGKSGDKVRILSGEELDGETGNVLYNMRCSCVCDEYFTLKDGQNFYKQFDYRGFRYIQLIPDNGVVIKNVKAFVRHYPFDDSFCVLKSDSEILNRIWDICKNVVKYGSQEVYVDCPTREKGQYSGDLTVTSDAHLVLTGDPSLLRKGMDDIAESSFICKGLMAVAPSGEMQEIADYSLQYSILALRYYEFTGDKTQLHKDLEICESVLKHFSKFSREDGLLDGVNDKTNLVDWPQNLRDGYDFDLCEPVNHGCHNVINSFYIGAVIQTEQIKDILNIPYIKMSDTLIKSFDKAFLDKETMLYTDSETSNHSSVHSNIIPLYYGFLNEKCVENICDFLISDGFKCGVYMAYFMLKGLCRYKKYREVYNMIVSENEHSWGNMVKEGASTCFEAWGKEQKWNTSLCHPWACAPVSVLAKDVLPNCPDLGKIIYNK